MKSEHRHQLQTNDLSKLTDKVGHTVESYSNQLLWVVCAILLVTAAGVWWIKTSRAKETSAWTSLASAQTAEQFADVAASHAGTQAALWARLQEADEYLRTGIRESFTNREKANTDLKKAKEAFEKLVAQRSAPAPLRERALFGLAKSLETTSDGDLAPAVSAYETLVAEFPNSVFRKEADARIADLKGSNAQSFYAWFHAQNPKPPELPKPQDGKTSEDGKRPAAALPRLDDEPAADAKTGDKAPAEAGDKPAAQEPAGDAAKEPAPPAEKPAAEKPAAEDGAKSGEAKPGTEPAAKPAAPQADQPQSEAPQDSQKPAENN
jgi:hypothetical protein